MLLNLFRDIQPLFSSKAKRIFRKVTSLRDALVFMVANGDPTRLKDCKSWEKPGKPVVARPDAAGMFDSLFSTYIFPTLDFLHHASSVTSSYVNLFILTVMLHHLFSQRLFKKKKWTLRSPYHLEHLQES